MAESEDYITIPSKKYRVPQELAQKMPIFHANFVHTGVTESETALTFCTKLDLMIQEPESDVLIPHACLYLSHSQAEKLARSILKDIAHMREHLESPAEEDAPALEEVESNV